MRAVRNLPFALFLLVGLGGFAAFIACQSAAETPNAFFGFDGGPGSIGEPCRSSNVCNDPTLICTTEGDAGVCRLECDPANPACGASFNCTPLLNTDGGVCEPAVAGEGEGEGGGGQ
jgi:hypothetical protein